MRVEEYYGAGDEWDRFVGRTPGASFAHLAAWREVLPAVYGYRPLYLVALDDGGEWLGALPLFEVRSRIFGRHLLSVPLMNAGGAVGTPEARTRLAEFALEHARASGARSLVLRDRDVVACNIPESRFKVTVLLDLPDSPEALWNDGLRSKLRSQIRRAMKEAMEVRFGPDQLRAFHDVYSRNMRDLGTPAHPVGLFDAIARAFAEHVIFGAVYWRGMPVAAGCGFLWRGTLEMTWASSLREHNRMAPNMLLYWSFMEEAIRRGARVFDFGRCSPGSGTHRFKLQWGGREVPLPWRVWSRDVERAGDRAGDLAPETAGSPAAETAGDPAAAGPAADPTARPAMRLARAAWRRLPHAVARRFGGAIARELPWW